MTLMEKGGRPRQGRQPAKLVLGRSAERTSEASQEKMGVQFVRFAACRMKELDGGIERCDDFDRARAFFGNLALQGDQGPLSGLETATRKEHSELVDDARHLELFVEDHCIGRAALPIGSGGFALAKGLDGGHTVRRVRYSGASVSQTARATAPRRLHNSYIRHI